MSQQQSTAQVPAVERICTTITGDLFKQKLQQSLPPGLDVERYSRTAVNAIQMHPQKDKFNNCDVQTLFLAVQRAATDGLLLDGREATLIAFWDSAKNTNNIAYIPMVQGMVKVARNSGEIASIDAHVVYEQDDFRFRPGIDAQPIFEPDWKLAPSKRGEPVLAFCVIKLKDETIIAPAPMHRERILQIGNAGKNGRQYNPETGEHWAEWWKKTAIKNALKYAPKSSEMLSVEKADNDAQEFDFNKLRDVSRKESPEAYDVNEMFKPKLVQEAEAANDQQSSETIEQPIEEIKTQPVESGGDKHSPAYEQLVKYLNEAATIEDAKALKKHNLLAKINQKEKSDFLDLVENKVMDFAAAAEDQVPSAEGMFSK